MFDDGYGDICNFSYKNDSAPVLGNFSIVSMPDATAEELSRLTDVYEINLYKRSEEDIRMILDGVPGIKYVITREDSKNDALAPDYPLVKFS